MEAWRLERAWRLSRRSPRAFSRRRRIERILLVPGDPGTLAVSLGDDAMVTSVAEMARARNPMVAIDVLTGSVGASRLAVALGMGPVEIWESPSFVPDFVALLEERRYDAVVALGADVMDGAYDFLGPAKAIVVVDIAARSGIPSSVLGFSFSGRPRIQLAAMYGAVDDTVQFDLRDEISLARFRDFCGSTAQLVADSAFMLTPAIVHDDLAAWVEAMRADGRKVIGINLHPMLFPNATALQIDQIVRRCVTALVACAATVRVAWLLLPHDYRNGVGDEACLSAIYRGTQGQLGATVRYFEGRHRAATLKGVVGLLDGVVSARMHLAIAALGMSTPTLAVTYHGKFEGLYMHFGLPDWLLLTPRTYVTEGAFEASLSRFIGMLPELKAIIQSRQDAVRAMSRRNFAIFDPDVSDQEQG